MCCAEVLSRVIFLLTRSTVQFEVAPQRRLPNYQEMLTGSRITKSPSLRLRSVLLGGQRANGTSKFPKLLEPLQLAGGVTLRNRVLMGSMHTGLEESKKLLVFPGDLDEMAAFYAERAKGGVGLIVTGGIAPNFAGTGYLGAAKMTSKSEASPHKTVTAAVHENGGKIAMQILHTGRYAYHPFAVSSSAVRAPINQYTPKALSTKEVDSTIDDFVRCAELAKFAGYDGVEVMGSEGYFINQFLVNRVNKRTDKYGGSYENRMRLPVDIVRKMRAAVGPEFIIIYRLSMLDLVEDGSSWEEIVQLAQQIRDAGASIINTGIGWHEARIPTIATMVPRGAFAWVTEKMRKEVTGIPFCTTNRINHPAVAEDILSRGSADMISMARPFLADPYFVQKAAQGKEREINSCIGCNQACLDHIFVSKRASCLVNPVAGYETSLKLTPAKDVKKVAVIGAGPAGLACATSAAQRGHQVTLFDSAAQIGGQFNLAKLIPGKEEFFETVRYFGEMLKKHKVNMQLQTPITSASQLHDFDAIVLATGVTPRNIDLPNRSNGKVKVLSYLELLKGGEQLAGKSVAVVGAGGIGFDVADFLSHPHSEDRHDHASPAAKYAQTDSVLPTTIEGDRIQHFLREWQVDTSITRGGLQSATTKSSNGGSGEGSQKAERKIFLLQRKSGKLGSTLGKTTGWVHKATIKRRGVEEIAGVNYVEITEEGLVIEVPDAASSNKGKKEAGKKEEKPKKVRRVLPVDTVIICAGQEPLRDLYKPLLDSSVAQNHKLFVIGGAYMAGELDAKRAIDQGTRLAAQIELAHTNQVFDAPISTSHKVYTWMQQFGKKK